MDDFILVALHVEEGRSEGELVHYVGKLVDIEEDGNLSVSFLRVKSPFTKDTFTFPAVEDVIKVDRVQCKGVLMIRKGSTQRQATQVNLVHPLSYHFNVR